MIYQVIPDEPHYSLPSSFPRPIETLSHRRHRYNNVACQSIRPISRELKLQRGSFRVNFPAIKTGNVRNCGEIAVLQLPPFTVLPSSFSPGFRRGAHRVYHRSRYFHVDANQVTSRRRINTGVSPFAKLRGKFAIIDIPLKRAVLFNRLTQIAEIGMCNVDQNIVLQNEVKSLITVYAKFVPNCCQTRGEI